MSEQSASTVEVHIVSAHGHVWSGQARMICATSVNGSLGILPRHSPLMSKLLPGEVRIRTGAAEDDAEYLYVSGGFIEVQPHVVTILADTAVRSDDLDEAQALEAKRRAEQAMADAVLYTDRDRARAELLKAIAQLQTLQDARKRRRAR